MAVIQRGDKLRIIREVMEALGADCKLSAARVWIKQKYGPIEIGDTTFYRERSLIVKKLLEEGERQRYEQEQAQEQARLAEIQRKQDAARQRQISEQRQREEEESRRRAAEESARQRQQQSEELKARQAAAAEAEKLRSEIQTMTPSQQVATRMLQEGELPATPNGESKGVTILVKAAKVLIGRLGKDEAKQLIDAM